MELFPYQKEAVKLVKDKKKNYLALAPGLGKTLTSLTAGLSVGNVLVVAEKNEIENSRNFEKEVLAHFSDTASYFSLREYELDELPKGKKIVAGINPEMLSKLPLAKLLEYFSVLIVDEATLAKNIDTIKFKSVHAVAKSMAYVILLSGTPMMNGAAEIYAPLLLLDSPLAGLPSSRGSYEAACKSFEVIFANGHMQKMRSTGNYFRDYIWVAKDTRYVRELRYLVRDCFHFVSKTQVQNLFKKKPRRMEYVEMTPQWIEDYDKAWNEYIASLGARFGDLTPKQFAKKLENITDLQRLIENSQIAQINSQYKARQIVEDIKSGKYGKKRIVVFSRFVETDNLLLKLFQSEEIGCRTFEEINDWKKGREQVLLGRIKAHGKGTNAPEACVGLFVDMSFVPSENVQAENRIDRPEQENDMEIVYYSARRNGIDEAVDARVREVNQEKAERIEEFMRPLTDEELTIMPGLLQALRSAYPKDAQNLGI